MAQIISDVQNQVKINSAEFVKLVIVNPDSTSVTYTFSSSYQAEIIEGQTYTPLGGLISIGTQQKDLTVTAFDTVINLVGVDENNINLVLATPIRGSTIEIRRGFYDNNYILTSAPLRYTGIVTAYTISEDKTTLQDLTYTVTLNCSNYKTVLENQVPGRFTVPSSWNQFFPNDTSMNNVPNLNGASFDFGKKA
jgi:hypothetical protein